MAAEDIIIPIVLANTSLIVGVYYKLGKVENKFTRLPCFRKKEFDRCSNGK